MCELDSILRLWMNIEKEGGQGVLATVVDVRGSAYRLPGARMLVASDGRRAGTVSGGCLEADIARKAWWWTESPTPIVRTYDTTSHDDAVWEFGLGCNGVVRVLIERLGRPVSNRAIEFLTLCRMERKVGVMSTVISTPSPEVACVGDRWYLQPGGISNGAVHDLMVRDWTEAEADAAVYERRSRILTVPHSLGKVEVFVEVIPPPVPLVIFGAGHDAAPVVRQAKSLGWHVTIADARPSYAQAFRFPGADRVILTRPDNPFSGVDVEPDSAVVVMNHNYEVDRNVLQGMLKRPVKYLGVLGPRLRTQKMLADLHVPSAPSYLHAPVGLDLGGDTPETIALSIVAEMQAVLSNRDAGMLRDSEGSIHPPAHEVQQIALCA